MRKLFVKLKKQIMKILKIIILLLISTSVFGQIKGTQEVNNIKINGEIKTSTITPNIIPDYVITKDTTNDITTYSSVSDVTAVSIASLVDTLELYEFDSLNVVKLIIDNSYITQDADTLLAVMNGIKMLRMTEDTIYIDSTAIFGGNVGIGTTSPGYKLDVNGNIQISNNQPYLILNDTTVDESNFYLVANGDKFYIGPTSQSTTNAKLTILDTGNVGIGTISPGAKLDVSGTGRFSGALTVIAPTSDLHAATKKYVDEYLDAFAALTTGTATWSTIGGLNKTWVISANATLTLTNLASGMFGDVKITVTNTPTVTLAASGVTFKGAGSLVLSAGTYHLCWVCTSSTTVEWNIHKYQ